jgi:hypothetical protein
MELKMVVLKAEQMEYMLVDLMAVSRDDEMAGWLGLLLAEIVVEMMD